MNTIAVTINPDGSCKECHPKGKRPVIYRLPQSWEGYELIEQEQAQKEYSRNLRELGEWERIESTLRTFEIERGKCICHGQDRLICRDYCESKTHILKGAHTAEILPNNKVKILS